MTATAPYPPWEVRTLSGRILVQHGAEDWARAELMRRAVIFGRFPAYEAVFGPGNEVTNGTATAPLAQAEGRAEPQPADTLRV
ncbi:hypothetical protein HL658_31255 [Azospirillum sp. RWY-5-1]|uniref:Uncharacterized protein n=1 Tax=Azospirillum oleiclasticum TaxID=2735135 RepID=A0ABX2TMF9_9PROT|nr:hypothetical protein [Azospirillum oleiclasticum]NYZ17043.1 hypothetical protein [Azospirillum oleiclasticum]NYZ24513.1 hypothetical protein [Azospirillum oleiclasticum]